jgi:hypothetical protein
MIQKLTTKFTENFGAAEKYIDGGFRGASE